MADDAIRCVYCLALMTYEDEGVCPECGHYNGDDEPPNYFNTQTGPYDND